MLQNIEECFKEVYQLCPETKLTREQQQIVWLLRECQQKCRDTLMKVLEGKFAEESDE